MKALLASLLLLPGPAFADPVVTTLRMRPDADAFDGRRAPLPRAGEDAPPPREPAGKPAGPARSAVSGTPLPGGKALAFISRFVTLEGSMIVRQPRSELEPLLRVDAAEILDAFPFPEIKGRRILVVDVAVVDAGVLLGMLATYGAGKAVGSDYLQGAWQRFYGYSSEHGPIGVAGVDWKDPNYGDPWINDLGHPMGFQAAGTYFRKRGYGVAKAFTGCMAINGSWEFMFENYEQPKSGHDLFFVNLAGCLAGAHPDLGIAWGVDPFRFTDEKTHYTEYYYRRRGSPWRGFVRTEPNGDYQNMRSNPRIPKDERPLFVSDVSIGAAREDWGVTAFVTGVADTGPKSLAGVHGPRDVVDELRLGVSLDMLKVLPKLR